MATKSIQSKPADVKHRYNVTTWQVITINVDSFRVGNSRRNNAEVTLIKI